MITEATKQQVIDVANIVEVVSDYISLTKRGVNYVGLCPFHNDRRPSFYVSASKNICKCFACGEGGTPISFIMKIEKVSFSEAIRVLAHKYGIPIEEREETDAEKQKRNEQESMFLAQQFAATYFNEQLLGTVEGKNIALPYLFNRGITMPIIEKFGLGYAPQAKDGLYNAATKEGFNIKYFAETGLCYPPTEEYRTGADRFRERVIFPIHTVSGKVVGFGGRIMKSSDRLAKYINSPESPIYSKSRELYGLYLAKKAITQADKCFLVEGYMDVIAMHQAGVENVVASSGTALTIPQIALIRRFTTNITVFYDGDAAGIKATLRGIDLLLEAGMHVRALPLPEGEDPDSFVRNNTIDEFNAYIAKHEIDFISFKTALYKHDMEHSPIEKANLVNDLLRSVAAIPDPIERSLTAQSLAQELGLKDELVSREVKVFRNNKVQSQFPQSNLRADLESTTHEHQSGEDEYLGKYPQLPPPTKNEYALLRLIIRYGSDPLTFFCDDGTEENIALAVYALNLLVDDGINDFGELFKLIIGECCAQIEQNPNFNPGKFFANHENQQIANLALTLLTDKYILSNVSKQALGINDSDDTPPNDVLLDETDQLVNGMKGEYILRQIEQCKSEIKLLQTDPNRSSELLDAMLRMQQLNKVKAQIAELLGNRTIIP